MLNTVSAIHSCALHPDRWHEALVKILDYLGGTGGMLWSHQATPGSFGLRVPCRLHPESLAEYERHYHQKDVWMQAGYARGICSGEVMTGEMLLPRPTFLQSAFYREFLRRFDYEHLLLGVLHMHDGSEMPVPTVHFRMYRGQADKPFDENDRKKLQALLPHMQHATAINFHLADRDHRLCIAQAAVDLFNDALFFADRSGRIVYANRAAQELLAQGDGLSLKDQRLVAANAAENHTLQKLFESARQAGLLRISRLNGKQSYVATRVQVAEDSKHHDAHHPHQAVLIHDPEMNMPARITAMSKRYGLTAAESHIVAALLRAGSAKKAAVHMGLSDNTVKTHLKSIFNKTGTHRQSELVQLVMGFPRL